MEPSNPSTVFQSSIVKAAVIILILAIGTIIFTFETGKPARRNELIDLTAFVKTASTIRMKNNSHLSQRQFDVVLSYYQEDVALVSQFIKHFRTLPNIHNLNPRIIVYNKNPEKNSIELRTSLQANLVIPLPNIGREGATYLYHIIHNYDTIADHTIFSQAGVEDMIENNNLSDWFHTRLVNQFNANVGFMPLVTDRWISVYDCGYNDFAGHLPRLTELWSLLEHTLCPSGSGGQAVSLRGQFLVSGKRVRSRPLPVYQYLYDLITANQTHWIHQDKIPPNSKSTPEAPLFGHTIERAWTVIFRCANPDLAEKCAMSNCSCTDD